EVGVVPTRSIPQGISALLAFHPESELEDNKKSMEEASTHVKTGQVTYAVRDTQVDGITIKKGTFMWLADVKIKSTHKKRLDAVHLLLDESITEDDEILTIVQGEEAEDSEVKGLEAFIEETYEDIEIETHNGEQPIYSYILSVE